MFSWIPLPGSAVPETATAATLASFTGFVTEDATGFAGATVSFTLVIASETGEGFAAASVATAVAPIVPSANDDTSTPETLHAPSLPATTAAGVTCCVPSVTS